MVAFASVFLGSLCFYFQEIIHSGNVVGLIMCIMLITIGVIDRGIIGDWGMQDCSDTGFKAGVEWEVAFSQQLLLLPLKQNISTSCYRKHAEKMGLKP